MKMGICKATTLTLLLICAFLSMMPGCRPAQWPMNLPLGAPWERLLAVKKISVFQGNLVYAANASGEKIEAGDIDLNIKLNMSGGANSAEPFKKIKLTGDIKCKMFRINDVTLMNLVMSASGEKSPSVTRRSRRKVSLS